MPSASLWGCELKYWNSVDTMTKGCVSLLVRLWIEIYMQLSFLQISAVSLLVRLWIEMTESPKFFYQCLSSASLWGCELKSKSDFFFKFFYTVSLLVRLWIEIYMHHAIPIIAIVSLLVRLWIEIIMVPSSCIVREVSLLVRLWIEIQLTVPVLFLPESASLWGCELKFHSWYRWSLIWGQPPCEAVNWNMTRIRSKMMDQRSASLWGCELK